MILPRPSRRRRRTADAGARPESAKTSAGVASEDVSQRDLWDRELRSALDVSRLERDVALAPFTTFRIGGPADFYYPVTGAEDLALAVTVARERRIPWFLLGTGANILVGDLGFRGLVIYNCARRITVDPSTYRLSAESGALMWPDVLETALSHRLAGLEHYPGIPSSVGGALWQNLHFLSPPPARERTMFIEEVLHSAELLTDEGERRIFGADDFHFGYDDSILQHRRHIVLSATFQLEPGDPQRLREVIEANLAWRRERHPPLATEPSAGSIFRKIEGLGAGRLIDECGLKGCTVGGAMVSHRHANIFINRGGATADDVRRLIDHVQKAVARETGYALEVEISFVGDFVGSG